MHLRFHSAFHRAFSSLLTILLLGGTIAAQDTRKTQEQEVVRLMSEGLQLATEGSPASLRKAIDKFELAREPLQSLNFPAGEGVVLCAVGIFHSLLEENQKAIEKLEQSLPFFREAGEKRGEGVSLLQLGLIHSKLGEMEKGLDYLKRAFMLFHEVGESQGEATALGLIGTLYIFLGKPEEMVNYYNKVLEVSRATAPCDSEAAALPALGPIYKLMGVNLMDHPEKAREGMEQLLSVSRTFHIPRAEAMALLMLGLNYSAEGEPQKALRYYEQSLSLFRAQSDRMGEGAALLGVCMSHTSPRDYQKGSDYCAQALAINRATGDRNAESLTLQQIAIGERNRGNLAAAQTAIESVIANVESIRSNVVNPALRLSYFVGSQNYYEFYIDLLMLLHKQHPNDGYDGKALQAVERARARALLDTLMEANADIRQGVDAALLRREREGNAGSMPVLRARCYCFRSHTQRHKPHRSLKRSKRLSRICSKSKQRSGEQALAMPL